MNTVTDEMPPGISLSLGPTDDALLASTITVDGTVVAVRSWTSWAEADLGHDRIYAALTGGIAPGLAVSA